MSRIIKFRAWDNEENKYFEPIYDASNGKLLDLSIGLGGDLLRRTLQFNSEHESCFPDRYVIEQFTGLIDKNGKDIYEGDIVSFGLKYKSTKIIFEEGAFGYISMSYFVTLQESNLYDIEVIGNIHEDE